MKSTRRGKGTSGVEVTEITDRGITVCLGKETYFLRYKEFPWFQGAREKHVLNVRQPHASYLSWPDLDVELEVDSLISPARYPLISRESPMGPTDLSGSGKKRRP